MGNATDTETVEVEIIGPDLKKELRIQANKIEALVVKTDDDYRDGSGAMKALKEGRATVAEKFKPLKKRTDEAHKEAVALERSFLAPIDAILSQGKQTLLDYKLAQEAEEKAEREKLRREAEEAARKERVAEEERRRKEVEAKAAEERRQKAEDVAKLRAADLDKEADELAGIEVVPDEPEPVDEADFVPEVVPEAPKHRIAGGAGTSKRWKARVTDLGAFCRAVGASKHLEMYIEPDMAALNRLAVTVRKTESGIEPRLTLRVIGFAWRVVPGTCMESSTRSGPTRFEHGACKSRTLSTKRRNDSTGSTR